MKKLKKFLIPLLVIICIPFFLAGCGNSNNGFIQNSNSKKGQIWYVLNDNRENIITYVLLVKANKISYVSFSTTDKITPSDIQSNTPSGAFKKAEQLARKINSKNQASFAIVERNISFSVKTSSKQERILLKDDQGTSFTLTDPNTHIKENSKTFNGYKCKDNDGNQGYLVTNTNQKLGFDKKQ